MTDQDQTTTTTMSTLVDHVVVTNTVVEQLAGHGREVPRYIADEIGQAVLALVPDAEPAELTPVQYALLDALRDVALSSEAPSAQYAGKEVARLAAEALGYPLPVTRISGFADLVLDKPVVSINTAGVAPIESLRRQTRATGGVVDPKALTYTGRTTVTPDEAGKLGLSYPIAKPEPEPWPFKPGTVVRDEDGAEVEWLNAAPVGTVVRVAGGYQWTRQDDCWDNAGRLAASLAIAQQAPVTVVSVPDQEADRG